MGFYLNSKRPYLLFAEEARAKYFVDKSDILAYLIPETEPAKEAGAESLFLYLTSGTLSSTGSLSLRLTRRLILVF